MNNSHCSRTEALSILHRICVVIPESERETEGGRERERETEIERECHDQHMWPRVPA